MTRVDLAGVSITIGDVAVVHGADLTASPGEVVGVLGPNGSGKSTLLKAVYRALRPRTGAVLIDDVDVWTGLSARAAARQTATVTQHSSGELRLSVAEVVLMGRIPHQTMLARTSPADRRAASRALREVGLLDAAGRAYSTLSGGERQRALLARALCQQPRLLVLDEPTNHLDIAHQLDFLELVRRLGTTTLIVLHDLNLAATYCDRLYLLSAGRVVAAGPVSEVLTPDVVRTVFGVRADLGTHPVTGAPQLSLSPVDPTITKEPGPNVPSVP